MYPLSPINCISIECHYTNKFHILYKAHILRADVPPNTPIDYRCMEYHYRDYI